MLLQQAAKDTISKFSATVSVSTTLLHPLSEVSFFFFFCLNGSDDSVKCLKNPLKMVWYEECVQPMSKENPSESL